MARNEENQKPEMQWICSVCGYTHVGPEPPKECPKCGVDAQFFDVVE